MRPTDAPIPVPVRPRGTGLPLSGEETMPNGTTYSGILGNVQRFHASMETTVRQIPHLEAGRLRLGDVLDRAQDLLKQQAAMTAAKQELSQQIKTAMEDVQLLATLFRKGVRQHFGKRSEK